jgi:NTE family protein
VDRVSNLRVSQAARVLLDSLDIMTNMIAELRLRLERPDLIIRPEITQYALFDEVEPEQLILRGEEIVIKMRDQIETIFKTSKRIKRWLHPTTPPAVLLSQLLKQDSASL